MNGENLNNNNNMPDMDDALWDMPTDMNNMTYVEGQGYVNTDYYNAWKEHAEGVRQDEKEPEDLEAEPAPEDKKQLKMSWAMMMNYYKKNPDEISDLTEDSERAAKAAEGVRNDDRKELDKIITEYIAAGRKKLGKVAVEATEAAEAEGESATTPAEAAETVEATAEPELGEKLNQFVEETVEKPGDLSGFNFLKRHDAQGREIEEDKKEDEKPDYTIDFSPEDDWDEMLNHGKFPTKVAADWIE